MLLAIVLFETSSQIRRTDLKRFENEKVLRIVSTRQKSHVKR